MSAPAPLAGLLAFLFATQVSAQHNLTGYEAPDDCRWWPARQEVHLACSLRTVNSDLDVTNFSMIPAEHTVSLSVACDPTLAARSALEEGGFSHLTNLKQLALEYCKLTRITPGTLQGLGELRNLSLRTHNVDLPAFSLEVSRDSFSGIKQLERLDLSLNNIWSFPENVFCPMTNLVLLNVSWNRLQDVSDLGFREKIPPPPLPLISPPDDEEPVDLPPSHSPCSLDVQLLDASGNHFVLLPAQGFGALRGLKELYLSNNEISMIAERALGGLSSLVKLDVSNNKIVALPSELFREAHNSLQEIYLQNNSISVLSPGLFADLNQLLSLDLSHNQLTSAWINSGTFSGLIRLVLLNLSYNRITKLDPTLFHDLYTLQILNLEHNFIETIPPDTFTPMNNLHTLVLSYNKISKLDAFALNGLYVLSLLSLDNNLLNDIHTDAFRNCTGLQDLNLNGNKLTSIPLALTDMRILKTVDLGENSISDLDKPGFLGMTNLYGLRLIGNQVTSISKGAFSQLPSLQIVNLSRNKISKVQSGAFEGNSNLQAIRMDANELTDINGIFTEVPTLLWLNISDNKLEWFDYAMLPQGLQWLDIHKNSISELGNHYNLESELHIQTLDASFNKLTRVSSGSIPNSVELLFINDNLITMVEPHTFIKKVNLSRVDLYANQIEEMELNALHLSPVEESRPLPEFYIGGNPFQCDCTMEWLQRINKLDYLRQHPKVMDLEGIYCKLLYSRERLYIPLVEAEPAHFLCSYKTHCFALCTCCDFDACDCEMTCPQNCTCYHDQSWAANIVDCSAAGYVQMPTSIPMDATEVYLDGNNFGELSSHSFIGRKNLKVLYANNSNIAAIYNHTFSGLRRLLVLHLENNRIKELLGSELSSLESLREIYLQGNQIQYLSNRTFEGLKQLEVLRLENNRLHRFSVNVLLSNPYLVEIGLARNQWSCECGFMKEFSAWLRGNYAKVADAREITCVVNNKTNFVGPNLKDFNSTWCTVYAGRTSLVDRLVQYDYLPLLLATMAAFVAGSVLVCASFLYRRELRLWVYDKCRLQLQADNEDRVFDAYIVYSAKDDVFVREALAPGLEPPYRLCLHYRDFSMSSYVADTMVEAVESSRRTVLVVTRNFLTSEWCRFEFKSALGAVLRERGGRGLVAVLGSGLRPHDLDPELRLHLKTSPLIEWGDRAFWQKLRYAMPEPRPHQQPKALQPHFLHHNSQPLWA